MILHAVEKFGKTSFAAQSAAPIFLMPSDETGLLTLIDAGQLKETPYLPPTTNWADTLDAISFLTDSEHNFKTLVIDTGNGMEKLCHQFVCDREYAGDWGKKGFASYMQGFEVSCNEWRLLLAALDKLRELKRMGIIMLCHSKITTFKNPEGNDYDRYSPAMHNKTWELTHRWADIILFGNYFTQVEKEGVKAKAKGGQQRVLYTQRHAAYDAGNRCGLPEEIDCGNSAQEAFANFIEGIKAGRAAVEGAK